MYHVVIMGFIFMRIYCMSEVSERLARVEQSQIHQEKQLDRIVTIIEKLSDNEQVIMSMQVKIDRIEAHNNKTDAHLEKLYEKCSQIENAAMQNKIKIATISATVSMGVGAIAWWFKQKFTL
jgi:biopolymer transport protein ExbB/TolQ